jgi:bacterioferritin-associated ferredoxin
MIVCHCHGLTDRDIREAAQRTRAGRCEDLQAACPAATCCGGCRPLVERILSQQQLEAAPIEADRQPGTRREVPRRWSA